MIWISTIVTTATTAVLFVLLAKWSAGGPAPWSIVPGLARGIRVWGRREDDLEPIRFISPMAQTPEPPIDVAALPLSPFQSARREPQEGVAVEGDGDAPVDVDVEIEIEELGTRRI